MKIKLIKDIFFTDHKGVKHALLKGSVFEVIVKHFNHYVIEPGGVWLDEAEEFFELS